MKLFKQYAFAALAAGLTLCLAACSDDDDYQKGKPAGEYNVGFAEQTDLELDTAATSFDVTLVRTSSEGELTVPVEAYQVPDFCTVPSSATFANGEATTTITVTIGSGMAYNTTYDFAIRIPEEYTNAYLDQDIYPIYKISISKPAWNALYKGIYTYTLFFGSDDEPYEAELTLSQRDDNENIYKLSGWGYNGEDFTFQFLNTGYILVDTQTSGYVHPSYGEVMVTDYATYSGNSPKYSYYDSETGMFYFAISYYVSAGSFGSGYETYQITDAAVKARIDAAQRKAMGK